MGIVTPNRTNEFIFHYSWVLTKHVNVVTLPAESHITNIMYVRDNIIPRQDENQKPETLTSAYKNTFASVDTER